MAISERISCPPQVWITMNDSSIRRRRGIYATLAILLIVVECLIARYVQDSFVRPYVGDILVVMVLYCLVRCILPTGLPWLPLGIFMFGAMVEWVQYQNILENLGLDRYRVLRIALGTVGDPKDVLCYGIGCLCIFVGSMIYHLREKRQIQKQVGEYDEEVDSSLEGVEREA